VQISRSTASKCWQMPKKYNLMLEEIYNERNRMVDMGPSLRYWLLILFGRQNGHLAFSWWMLTSVMIE
jgi:hypothetical protein